MKNKSIFAKVKHQCPLCGDVAVYEGVFKQSHLKRMEKGKAPIECQCGHTMELIEIVACQVMGHPEMDPTKVLGVI